MIFGILELVVLGLLIYGLILNIKSLKEDEKFRKHYICKFEEMLDRDRYLCYEVEDFIEDIKYRLDKFLDDEE